MHKIVLYIFFLLLSLSSFSQEVKKIQLVNADLVDYDEYLMGKDIKRLRGNVQFLHDSAIMVCDSAYFNTALNSIIAYGNVHINQGDTVHLYGDTLKYFGNTKMAMVRNRVNLVHGKANLTTDSLNFDRNTNTGYYFNWGTIRDSVNTLVSEWGYYYATPKDFVAIHKVILINPRYEMNCDTLRYNVDSETAFFFGPTTIVSDSNTIYCENGWYNTEKEQSRFSKNAWLKSKSQTLKGDSLYYDRNNGKGLSWGNVEIKDTVENMRLTGNYGEYYEVPERAFMTDSALFTQIEDADTLFLHADTLRMETFTIDSLARDTGLIDTVKTYKLITAWHGVRLFRRDFQSHSDSLVYSLLDSTLQLFHYPIVWFEQHQLTSDYIILYTKNNNPDIVDMIDNAFIISQEDSLRYNQLKGKKMRGYFKENELIKLEVNGNSQSIYFAKDGPEIIGVNFVECSNMTIYLADNDLEQIVFHVKPDATMYPPNEKSPDELKLKDFLWYSDIRPLKISDIFTRIKVSRKN